MSNGFPTRPTRTDFGPEPVNLHPVRDPTTELDGETVGRLMFHQLAGLGLVSALVQMKITLSSAPSATIGWRKEAWNTNESTTGDYAAPTLNRTGVGEATLAYAANIPDYSGTEQPVVFQGGWGVGISDDATFRFVKVIPSSVPDNNLKLKFLEFNAGTFSLVDGSFLVWLF